MFSHSTFQGLRLGKEIISLADIPSPKARQNARSNINWSLPEEMMMRIRRNIF
jgi:hypothetical protein